MAPDPADSVTSAGTVLASAKDLTPEQQSCADDVVEALSKANGILCTQALATTREDLWRLAFAPTQDTAWDTSKDPTRPTLPDAPAHKDLTTRVGSFNQDLPPSTCAVRHNKIKRKNENKEMGRNKKSREGKKHEKKPPSITQHRRAGERAFLRARYDDKTLGVEWFWSDAHGKGADPKFVTLRKMRSGVRMGLVSAQANALLHHDRVVTDHALAYNREYAAYWMRCRLLRYVGATPNGQRPTNPAALEFAALKQPRLLCPVALASSDTSEGLRRKMQTVDGSSKAEEGATGADADGGRRNRVV
ncbi:hypothetical protein TOPH_08288 [Tolypocladium ophioglossoides CBS 100239]|uniref:Uncharacterized protein n=1 Tax=Tolypocladium ophioglossoides (strain CBS 100239) TaxID=1163406 RepID=A0A0L0N016_TOLOC|nr:hypothetical protein TOPH_08288 [Tolypocladium ophioglossoides CBS 100239]